MRKVSCVPLGDVQCYSLARRWPACPADRGFPAAPALDGSGVRAPVAGAFDLRGLTLSARRPACPLLGARCRSRAGAYGSVRESCRPSTRPVLKHGPRSLTCARVSGWQTRAGAMKVNADRIRPLSGGRRTTGASQRTKPLRGWASAAQQERTRWDPKDGELCLSRTKPEETLVEVRSDSDVQIDRQT